MFRETVQGLRWLADAAPPGTRLSFYVQEDTLLTIPLEPIQRSGGDSVWVNQAMAELNFTQGAYVSKMFSLCNDRRSKLHWECDSWFIAFAIDDSCDFVTNDDGGMFANGMISFGSYHGPRITLLLYNGNGTTYQLDDIDKITVDETCHVFGAPDEYLHIFHEDCHYPWGYLREVNGNGWADTSGTICDPPQRPCSMNHAYFEPTLCTYTRTHLGWRDSDDPPDGIPDPIDHPDSRMSMLIGEGDSLVVGDRVDIRDSTNTWVKRLTASQWSMDRGRVLWDGIGYDGLPDSTGAYSWRRNTGSWHSASLIADTSAPVISDLMVVPRGVEEEDPDTLSFRFLDSGTHAARVRAIASADGSRDTNIWDDRFFRETQEADAPITNVFRPGHDGLWTVTLQVWDVGGGHQARRDSTYWHGSLSGVGDQRIFVPEFALSRGRPNPSGEWIAWDLQLQSANRVDLRVVGVDGRCIRSWPGKALPGGVTKVLWNGVDDRDVRVAAGRYYLVVTDEAGTTHSTPVTVVR